MFQHRTDGSVVTRDTTCECGTAFQQAMLSERFMGIAEKGGGALCVTRDIPELYVPVHCPPCERKDLGRAARIAEARSLPEHRQPFGDRDAA
jgi:hypothetical protein